MARVTDLNKDLDRDMRASKGVKCHVFGSSGLFERLECLPSICFDGSSQYKLVFLGEQAVGRARFLEFETAR